MWGSEETSNVQRSTSNVELHRARNKFRLARLKGVAYDAANNGAGSRATERERKTIWLKESSGKNGKTQENLREKEGPAVPNPRPPMKWGDEAAN